MKYAHVFKRLTLLFFIYFKLNLIKEQIRFKTFPITQTNIKSIDVPKTVEFHKINKKKRYSWLSYSMRAKIENHCTFSLFIRGYSSLHSILFNVSLGGWIQFSF